MESFKYYKRGQGELDTSNFPLIVEQGSITVERLDAKTYVSLLALANYIWQERVGVVEVTVSGYVDHMRGDKDLFPVSTIYELLTGYLAIKCLKPQHESTPGIKSAKVNQQDISGDLGLLTKWFTTFVGADSSVYKFFPEVDIQAVKVREEGKVLSNVLERDIPEETKRIIIVDDILGGGATVKMLVEDIRSRGFTGELMLWVQYNESIHNQDFLDLFDKVYLGDTI